MDTSAEDIQQPVRKKCAAVCYYVAGNYDGSRTDIAMESAEITLVKGA